jgi:ribonucleoside-diphosphate reductase alpha chain
MYRRAWHVGLKTTYYLRTLQASNIEKSTVSVKKEINGIAGGKREYSAEEQLACSIEARRNGIECEVCQ